MNNSYFEIIGNNVKPFTHRQSDTQISDDGEVSVKESMISEVISIKSIRFIHKVERDLNTESILSSTPIEPVNIFLMSLHIDDEIEESTQHTNALIHYFSFLLKLREEWVKTEGWRRSELDPDWFAMPARKSKRPTYLYRKALKDLVLKQKALARTTAQAYMRRVVEFYKFQIKIGYKFDYPPFEHEVVDITFQAPATHMKPYLTKAVHTTDLRLKFGKDKRNDQVKQELLPLTNQEWIRVKQILVTERKILKNVNGEIKWCSFAYEYSLFFRLARYTGMRRIEVASLHLGQLPARSALTRKLYRMTIGEEAGSLTKGEGNPTRTVDVPVTLMEELINYTKSSRFISRQEKFKDRKSESTSELFDLNKGYLFISNKGHLFLEEMTVINNRWSEVRNTVSHLLGVRMQHKAHNLRPTYAVTTFRALLKKFDTEVALAYVSARLGHEDLPTTLKYLKIAEDQPTGDEIYEDILSFVDAFDEIEDVIGESFE
jgi:integrase